VAGGDVQGVLLQLIGELRDDVREVRDDVREARKDFADVLADLSKRVAVLEATRAPVAVVPASSAKRDVSLMAGASAIVAGIVELVRALA
jgi:hypothetical protein